MSCDSPTNVSLHLTWIQANIFSQLDDWDHLLIVLLLLYSPVIPEHPVLLSLQNLNAFIAFPNFTPFNDSSIKITTGILNLSPTHVKHSTPPTVYENI